MTRDPRIAKGIVIRLLIWTGAVLLLGGYLQLVARYGSVQSITREGGINENTQAVLLLIASTVLFIAGLRTRAPYHLGPWLASLLCLMTLVREHNNQLAPYQPYLGWKTGVLLLVMLTILLIWKHRTQFAHAMSYFLTQRCIFLFWAGLAVVLFAQMFGDGAFMERLFGEDYTRDYKRVAEESIETLGYLLLVAASIECMVEGRERRRTAVDSDHSQIRHDVSSDVSSTERP